MRFSLLLLPLLLLFFGGCSHRIPKKGEKRVVREYKPPKKYVRHSSAASRAYKRRVAHLRKAAAPYWGAQARVASRYEYVKYMQHYKARATIDFRRARVRVETTVDRQAKWVLKKAIMTTLLAPNDPRKIDLFSARNRIEKGVPFLFSRVRDRDGKPIRWRWRAGRYADYLIAHRLKKERVLTSRGKKNRYYVTFDIERDFIKGTGRGSYRSIVNKQARRFGIDPALILALIETESHFNPYATSAIPAYGLMQVVPGSAGKDAWHFVKKRKGRPSRNYLFNPANNIELGTAYVHLLMNRYLAKVRHPLSREYCAIAAYNTGSGNVLRSFAKNREEAFRRINRLSPKQLFYHLKKRLPYAETRRYIKKVTRAKRKYRS